MLTHVRANLLWILFLKNRFKNSCYACIALCFNLAAAVLEGVTFTCIIFSFYSLSGKIPFSWPQQVHDILARFSQVHVFTFFILSAVISQILRSISTYIGQIITVLLAVNLQVEAQKMLYKKIFYQTFASVNRYKMGTLIHHALSPPAWFTRTMEWINRVLVSLLMLITYVVLMMMISWTLTCAILALFVGTAICQRKMMQKIVRASEEQATHMGELNKETAQNLAGLRAVHLFGHQKQILKKINATIKEIARISLELNKWNQLVLPMNEVVGVVLVASCMGLGFLFLKETNAEFFPPLLALLTLAYRFTTRAAVAMAGCGEIAHNLGPINQFKTLLFDEQQEFIDSSDKPTVVFQKQIHFESVSLQYPNKTQCAVREISLTIPKGKVIAVVGPSGGGKSSLLDLLLRLYEPTEGMIYVDHKPLSQYSLHSWRQQFGVVSQEVFLFHDTIEANIRFGCLNASLSEIGEAARQAGASQFIDRLPEGYHTIVGEKGYKLSGGEKQRIALARALVRMPDILVLDEATSHLDSHSELNIQHTLEALRGKTTMMIVAHRLATISRADEILLLDQGRIVERGTHSDLLALKGHYHHYWMLQTRPSFAQKLENEDRIKHP